MKNKHRVTVLAFGLLSLSTAVYLHMKESHEQLGMLHAIYHQQAKDIHALTNAMKVKE